jgi:non-ribosomal peptide synthase protein (TIGR01720 family)
VTGVDGSDRQRLIEEQARAAIGRIDPVAGVMVQVVWFDSGPQEQGRLLLVVAHLVSDTVSLRILVPDLAEAYTTLAAGRQVALQPVLTSFRHWARALAAEAESEQRLAELPAWERALQAPDPLLTTRPVDPDRDTGATMREVSARVPVEASTALLTTVPAAFHAGVDEVLLTGLAAAVAEWRRRQGQDEDGVLVDLEGHGRTPLTEGVELSRTVGWFTSSHPVRLDVGALSFAEFRGGGAAAGRAAKRVKEQLRAVPGDGLGYGLLRFVNPESRERLAGLGSAQIGFNYLGRMPAMPTGQAGGAGGGPGRSQAWQPVAQGVGGTNEGVPVMHPLEAMAVARDLPEGPELTVMISWPGDLLPEPMAQALVDGWAAMLAGLAAHTTDSGGGGHTPSDFPLLDLDQDELDEFEMTANQIEEGA